MKIQFSKIRFVLLFLVLINALKLKADNYPLGNISGQISEFLIESNNQKSDMKNSIFYAEGEVVITNKKNEFIAKSEKAIFYKLMAKIKLIGNVEILSENINEIKASEVIYYIKENKFEALSGQNQKVNSKFVFDENNLLGNTTE